MKRICLLCCMIVVANLASAQKENLSRTSAGYPVNYEEDSVGAYILPGALTLANGKKVKNARTWTKKRRPEILKMIEEIQFGKMPPRPADMSFNVFDKGTPVFGGKAIRKQVTIYFTKDTSDHKLDLLIYLPANAPQPVPLFLGISFSAPSQVVDDSGVKIGEIWTKQKTKIRADQPGRFPKMDVEQFISQGFGYATFCYTNIEPDFTDGIKYGIRSQYLKPWQTQPATDEWGAISAWAWGLSRVMDYLETDDQIDAKRVAIQGTSRLGKTVLWAGAHDERFKMVIACCSGEGGAALARRDYGENIKHITSPSRFFYQFAPNYYSYAEKVNELPFDAHLLLALIAPRPLLLITGDTDYWSDPKGEFLSVVAAEPVYNLFGKKGPGAAVMPEAGDSSLLYTLGYYMHDGGHTVLPSDWKLMIAYMKKYL